MCLILDSHSFAFLRALRLDFFCLDPFRGSLLVLALLLLAQCILRCHSELGVLFRDWRQGPSSTPVLARTFRPLHTFSLSAEGPVTFPCRSGLKR